MVQRTATAGLRGRSSLRGETPPPIETPHGGGRAGRSEGRADRKVEPNEDREAHQWWQEQPEVGQCSLGGAYGQKQCSGISNSTHREQQQGMQHLWWK